jgi:hypothetical protein
VVVVAIKQKCRELGLMAQTVEVLVMAVLVEPAQPPRRLGGMYMPGITVVRVLQVLVLMALAAAAVLLLLERLG